MKKSIYVEVECGVCGAKLIRRRTRIEWNLTRNPKYRPICHGGCSNKKSRGRKGFVSKRESTRRNTLVRAGKASRWTPLMAVDEAIKAAGL